MKNKAVHFYSEKIEKKNFCFIPDVVAGVEIDTVLWSSLTFDCKNILWTVQNLYLAIAVFKKIQFVLPNSYLALHTKSIISIS